MGLDFECIVEMVIVNPALESATICSFGGVNMVHSGKMMISKLHVWIHHFLHSIFMTLSQGLSLLRSRSIVVLDFNVKALEIAWNYKKRKKRSMNLEPSVLVLEDKDCSDFFISIFHFDIVETPSRLNVVSCVNGGADALKRQLWVMIPRPIPYFEGAENDLDELLRCKVWVTMWFLKWTNHFIEDAAQKFMNSLLSSYLILILEGKDFLRGEEVEDKEVQADGNPCFTNGTIEEGNHQYGSDLNEIEEGIIFNLVQLGMDSGTGSQHQLNEDCTLIGKNI